MDLGSFMKANGLDDVAMAALIGGCSASAVKKWRYGERIPRPDHLRRIADATSGQVTPNDFLSVAPEAPQTTAPPANPGSETPATAQRSREVLAQQLDDSRRQLARQCDVAAPRKGGAP